MGSSSNGDVSNFLKAWDFTLRWEGGRVDNKNDAGGRTNMGVTQTTFNAWRDSLGLPRDDVFNITREEAGQIAKVRYWDAMGLDEVADRDPALATALFDWGFHSGTSNVLNRVNSAGVTNAEGVNDLRVRFLTGLKDFNHFGRGWIRRVEDLRKYLRDELPGVPAQGDVQALDTEIIQVFDGGHLFATFHPVKVSMGRTDSGRIKLMVKFRGD